MDLSINVDFFGILLVLFFVAAPALVGGGFVLYRKSQQVGWRAAGMSAMAGGVAMLLFLTITIPMSSEGGSPEPTISFVDTSSEAPTQKP